jgi:hypothetical protein
VALFYIFGGGGVKIKKPPQFGVVAVLDTRL